MRAYVTDATGAYAQINLHALLQALTSSDMSDGAFHSVVQPKSRILQRSVRQYYLSWWLATSCMCQTGPAIHVYDRIVAEGEEHFAYPRWFEGLIEPSSEKGYRDYGHDMDNTDSLIECGLTCQGEFVGKEAVGRKVERCPRAGSRRFSSTILSLSCITVR